MNIMQNPAGQTDTIFTILLHHFQSQPFTLWQTVHMNLQVQIRKSPTGIWVLTWHDAIGRIDHTEQTAKVCSRLALYHVQRISQPDNDLACTMGGMCPTFNTLEIIASPTAQHMPNL